MNVSKLLTKKEIADQLREVANNLSRYSVAEAMALVDELIEAYFAIDN